MRAVAMAVNFGVLAVMAVIYVNHVHSAALAQLDLQVHIERAVGMALAD